MVALTLRLPDDLHERAASLAQQEHRSLNAQIIVLLERALEEDAFPAK